MPSTTAKGFPYPLPTDTPDVPRDIQALATQVDVQPLVQAGCIVLTTNASGAFNITLPRAFPGPPTAVLYTGGDPAGNAVAAIRTVVANIPSTWTATVITGNAYRGDNGIAASVSARIDWLAVYM